MPETPRLPDDIAAVLDRCVSEMKARLVKELEGASDEDRLEVLARFRREIGSVRDKVTGRVRIGISGKWVLIASLLSAIGGGAVAGAVFSGDKQPTSTADSVAKAGEAECPLNQPGTPEGGATATTREEVAVEDAEALIKAAEAASSKAERQLHLRSRFFPKFIEAAQSENSGDLAKIRAQLEIAGDKDERTVIKTLLDEIEKAEGTLTPQMIGELQKLGVDTRQFAPEVAPEAPPTEGETAPKLDAKAPAAEAPDLTPERREERFQLMKQYVHILHRRASGNADDVAKKLQNAFNLDQTLLSDMRNQEWGTSIHDWLAALGIDFRELWSD